ncbi:MAG TPA: hypothetical protein VF453_02035 [Burkholderiaceae bacterium]
MSLENAYRKLLAVDPGNLPSECRQLMFVQPAHVLPVSPDLQIVTWAALREAAAAHDLFPKLGIKSWRDSGSSRLIARGMPMRPVIEAILSIPTWQQRTLMTAWTVTGAQLNLYLYPFVDFTDISESRWLASAHGCRFVSGCQRGRSAPLFGAALRNMQRLAAQIAQAMGDDPQVVELGMLPSGEVRLVEINPALTPAECKALMNT